MCVCVCAHVSQTAYCVYRCTADVNACACSCRHTCLTVYMSCTNSCTVNVLACIVNMSVTAYYISCTKRHNALKKQKQKREKGFISPVAFTL